ncbi:hypothetical protein MRB53_038989 [Persea americana]|nr:hypothetical protein MRB53_038989 [Persea americana]
MHKVDSIIASFPDLTLDDLVATRKINNDQRAQALKKPALQAALAQLEDQVTQYRKFEADFNERMAAQKAALQQEHEEELAAVKAAAEKDAEGKAGEGLSSQLLTLSRFLRAAAARRQLDDEETEESKDAKIKQLATEYAPFTAEESWKEGAGDAEASTVDALGKSEGTGAASDPTLATAGLNESTESYVPTNGAEAQEGHEVPAAGVIDEGTANLAAKQQWDNKQSAATESVEEGWVSVQREASEIEAPTAQADQRWADDIPTEQPPADAEAHLQMDSGKSIMDEGAVVEEAELRVIEVEATSEARMAADVEADEEEADSVVIVEKAAIVAARVTVAAVAEVEADSLSLRPDEHKAAVKTHYRAAIDKRRRPTSNDEAIGLDIDLSLRIRDKSRTSTESTTIAGEARPRTSLASMASPAYAADEVNEATGVKDLSKGALTPPNSEEWNRKDGAASDVLSDMDIDEEEEEEITPAYYFDGGNIPVFTPVRSEIEAMRQ